MDNKNNDIEKGISVIVCCYNSAHRLPDTLKHLANQEISEDIPVEVIIVNNASTDDTKKVAQLEWSRYNTNFFLSVIDEGKQGLMYARIKGVNQAKYEYVVFCDDDNWLESNYLQTAFGIMEADSSIGALGGQGVAVSDADFPDWFEDFKVGYAVGQQAKTSGDISTRGYLWGAGIVIRLSLLINLFDPKYPTLIAGRTGTALSSGDDNEMCRRILLMGYRLFYNENLRFKHFIPKNRLTWDYKKKLFDAFDRIWNSTIVKYNRIIVNLHTPQSDLVKSIFKLTIKYILFAIFKKDRENIKTDLSVKKAICFKSDKFLIDEDSRRIFRFYLEYANHKH